MLQRFSRWLLAAEFVLVVLLGVAWVLAWIANVGPLESFSPGGRSLFLSNWFTAETLGPSLVVGVIAIALLPLRHWRPVLALVSIGAAVLALEWLYPYVVSFSVTFSLKAAVFWTAWRVRQWWVSVPVIIPVVAALSIREFQINERLEAVSFQQATEGISSSTVFSVSALLEEVLFFAAVLVGGIVLRRVVEQAGELEERNRELIVERARASEAAVLDERLRISRELHDVVAHHVTTMTVHAGASRQLVDSNPEAATESLRQIEESGRTAVNELHQLLGFLRSAEGADDDRAPTPSLRHLAGLQNSVGGKLICELSVDGDLDVVPAAVDVSAYRIIQEAITNTMKHSESTSVRVDLVVGVRELTLAVIDDGPSRRRNGTSGGHGLVGMRERAALHGGEVHAGPQGTGWSVRSVLPYGGPT